METLNCPRRIIQDCSVSNVSKSILIDHVILLFLMTASLMIPLLSEIESLLINLPCCSGLNNCSTLIILRFSAVYVIYFLFCAFLDLTRLFVNRNNTGLWFAKILIIFGSSLASLYIQVFPIFNKLWINFIFFGATTFIVMEVYVLIRFSYLVIIKLQRSAKNGFVSAHKMQIVIFISGVVIPVIGEILLLHYYPMCRVNILFLITNAMIPFIACLWSMSDCVRRVNGYAGFAQGGIFACFIIFHTWSALTNDPNLTCNPYFNDKTVILLRECLFLILGHFIYVIGILFSYNVYIEMDEGNESIRNVEGSIPSSFSRLGESIIREDIVHVYIPQFANFFSASMISFVAVSVLNFSSSDISDIVEEYSKISMWCKFVGCWLSVLFFVFTLYTPSLYGIYQRKYLLSDR